MVLTKRAKFFDEEILPESDAELVGYAWLINKRSRRHPSKEVVDTHNPEP